MATLPTSPKPDDLQPDEEARNRLRPTVALRTALIASLGQPPELYRVTVSPLWLNYYRVNVLVGSDPTTVRIAHSYFVEAREDGRILTISPPIVRLYT